MGESVTLTVNGEPRVLDGPVTVAGLLAAIGLDARKVAVECREEIVPRSAYADHLAGGRRLPGNRALHRRRLNHGRRHPGG